jgi:tetratricopeptide (TPR) repeat protein
MKRNKHPSHSHRTGGRPSVPPAKRPPDEAPAPATGLRWRPSPRLLAGLILALAAFLAYANAVHHPFIFDDAHITEPASIRSYSPLWRALFPPSPSGLSGRPLAHFTLAVNWAISGSGTWSYHLVNVGIHFLAAFALFGLVKRTLDLPRFRERYGGASFEIGLASALFWMLHPIQTESVTYIIQRCESLAGLLYLASFLCAVRGWTSDRPRVWRLAAVLAMVAGVGVKETVVTLPFLAGLYAVVILKKKPKDLLGESPWLWGGWGIGLAAIGALAMMGGTAAAYPEGYSVRGWEYAITQGPVILHYLRLIVWPRDLCLDYGWPLASFGEALPGLVVVAMLLGMGVVLAFRRSPWSFPALWFFGILGPTSSVYPIPDPAFEHRLYLALAGPAVLAVLGLYGGWTWLQNRRTPEGDASSGRTSTAGLGAVRVVVIALAALLGTLTVFRNLDYQSGVVIWSDTIRIRPENPRAQYNLGLSYYDLYQDEKAIDQMHKALALKPAMPDAHLTLGAAYSRRGRPAEALKHLDRVFQAGKADAKAFLNYGAALMQLGRPAEAVGYFNQALAREPDFAEARTNLGVAMLRSGQLNEAIAEHEKAIRLKPELAEAHHNLGVALVQNGRPAEAIVRFREAVRLRPIYPMALQYLGYALLLNGQAQDALPVLERLIQMDPKTVEGRFVLGAALMQVGRVDEAVIRLKEVLAVQPGNADANANLGAAYLMKKNPASAVPYLIKALEAKPEWADVHANLGAAYRDLGNFPEARRHLEDALRINPKHDSAGRMLGQLPAAP